MIGTVPVYDSVIHYQRDLATLTAKDFIDVVRLHAKDGVDSVTLHCGITRKTVEQIKKHKRKMNIVSRGGSLVFAWMSMTGEENPFYEYFDEILDIRRLIRRFSQHMQLLQYTAFHLVSRLVCKSDCKNMSVSVWIVIFQQQADICFGKVIGLSGTRRCFHYLQHMLSSLFSTNVLEITICA